MKYLIAGLGNVGAEYEHTRHNIGFDILNSLAKKEELTFEQSRLAFYAAYKYRGRTLHLIQPTTFMNLSGKAVRYWMNELKIPFERTLIITDDIALPFGKLRLRKKGSAGGHNGLQNIIDELGSSKFPRLRFGIGDEFHRGGQVDYVLSKWSEEEDQSLPKYIDNAIAALQDFTVIGIDRTMNQYN